jgi:rhodanese-related sulfurtransferase
MQHSPGFLKIVDDARAGVREVSIAETRARLEAGSGVYLVDVREDREWALGHIAGAMHIGKGVMERDVEGKIADKDAEIILYCGGGYRSVLAAEALQKMGYTNVASMAGGWRAWAAAGYPVDL